MAAGRSISTGCSRRSRPRTKAICLNSPSNPVGWTASRDELIAVRDECRKRGLWIVADEVYSRFYYGGPRRPRAVLPRYLRHRGAAAARQYLLQELGDDRLARRLAAGAAGALGPAIERIIQYNSSGTAAFLQRGCVAALDHGEDFVDRPGGQGARQSRFGCGEAARHAGHALRNAARAPSICSSPSTA